MNRAKKLCVALIQMQVGKDRCANIKHAAGLIDRAMCDLNKVKLVILPECFNSPYGINHFAENAEDIPGGDTCQMLSERACCHGVYIVGGTIPEKASGGKFYNTCTVWNPSGEMIAVYRKMHLFNIDIPGKITFKESEVLSAGNEMATFDCEGIKVGLGICYDMRFPEFSHLYRIKHNCDMLVYPGAFNLTTGPLHWKLLQRARAIDSQMYILTCSPATGESGYRAWGHSAVNDPWGKHTSLEHKEDILALELDFDKVTEKRQNIPVFDQRRTDIYDLILKIQGEKKEENEKKEEK